MSDIYEAEMVCFNCRDRYMVEIKKGVSRKEFAEKNANKSACKKCGCKGSQDVL